LITLTVSQAGYTALHLAAEAGLPHVIAALLAAAPSLYGPSNNPALRLTAAGSTALHLAVTSGVRDCVELLLSDDPAESNTPDSVSYIYMAVQLNASSHAVTGYVCSACGG
jgi:ankyrin repeat protein